MSFALSSSFKNGIIVPDPDANAYLRAVEAVDGQPLEIGVAWAVNNFVAGCKADGIWNAIKASCILSGARTLAGALVPLVGPAPTNINFVGGDYNRKTGLVGNGSTKYLNSNYNANIDPQNDFHLSAYVSTVATSGANQFPSYIGAQITADSASIFRFQNNGQVGFRVRCVSATAAILGTGNETGLLGGSRNNASTFNTIIGGAVGTSTFPSTYSLTIPIFVFANNSGTGALGHSNGRLSFYSIGSSLNLTPLNARIATLMSTFQTAIP